MSLVTRIAPDFTAKAVMADNTFADLSLGRSVEEALRLLEALQHVEEHGEVCPADWHPGEDAMAPTTEGVASYLAAHS